MPRRYTAVVVGAGRIGAGYDGPGDSRVLTHCHALTISTRLRCIGLHDRDLTAAQGASAKWGIPAFPTLAELMEQAPDVAIICTPNASHADLLESLLAWRPRLVICEKPLTTSCDWSTAAITAYRERGIPLGVNYQRRYDPAVVELKERFVNGSLGALLGGTVAYSKGILHNGSHAVDLLRYLFGDPLEAVVTRHVFDHDRADPTVAGVLRFRHGEIALVAADERRFSLFEVDLIFETSRYRFLQSGMRFERWELRDDPVFPGYKELLKETAGETGLARALVGLTEEIAAVLDGTASLRIAAESIFGTQRVCERLARAPLATFQYLDAPS